MTLTNKKIKDIIIIISLICNTIMSYLIKVNAEIHVYILSK